MYVTAVNVAAYCRCVKVMSLPFTLCERLCTHKLFTKDQCFYLNYHKFSIKSYVMDVCLGEAILIHNHNIRFYGKILNVFTFYHFDSDPRFPSFLLYVHFYYIV